MTPDDEIERLLIEATVALDDAQERAPLTISEGLRQAQVQVHESLRAYRDSRSE
jgi:hypothetical protein